ncbi:MAG TPA: 50S ribosomal protein L10 [Candidatus Bathyarchaeia archaeon]|nr:50S ribosomal protein L10 [Candidatus Bathyarchaeia archaeon]
MSSTRKIAQWKKDSLEELQGLLTKYPIIAAADLTKVRSSQIHELRKRLRNRVTMIVAKNNLLRKSVELGNYNNGKLGEFVKDLTGSNILLFSDLNPFQLIALLDKSKVRVPAKGGDIATGEIMIPAGNTGLPPGPVISEFGEIKVKTKIESGSIWVAQDSVVAEKGDVISAKMASVLSKLGLKPMEAGLTLAVAFDNGTILHSEDLVFDLPGYKSNFLVAINEALNLSTEAGYMTEENTPRILVKGFRQALALAGEAGFMEEGSIEYVLKKAVTNATVLDQKIPNEPS